MTDRSYRFVPGNRPDRFPAASNARAEADWAHRVAAAATEAGDNAFRLDGKPVDRPVIDRARAVLRTANGNAR